MLETTVVKSYYVATSIKLVKTNIIFVLLYSKLFVN